ncbi:MAG: DUF4214 domain-containing protein [Cellulomonadaceae bacterium]|nr:DUF4214 domain-containing protein [Cellulomonadaceae bacterium]
MHDRTHTSVTTPARRGDGMWRRERLAIGAGTAALAMVAVLATGGAAAASESVPSPDSQMLPAPDATAPRVLPGVTAQAPAFLFPADLTLTIDCSDVVPIPVARATPQDNPGVPKDAAGDAYWGWLEGYVNSDLSAADDVYSPLNAATEMWWAPPLYDGDVVDVTLSYGSDSISRSATVSCNEQPNIARYVIRVYQELFDRLPDDAGINYWGQALVDGVPRIQVSNSITYSAEYRSNLISGSYASYLGRLPDGSGLEYWLSRMNAGWTISQMEAGFIASDEYFAASGSTPSGWVSALYGDVLGRAASGGEIAYWTGALQAGANRGQVAMGFLLSTEHLNTKVAGYYGDLLGRGIDVAGQAYWVRILQAGGRDEAIIGGIIASDEYFNRN